MGRVPRVESYHGFVFGSFADRRPHTDGAPRRRRRRDRPAGAAVAAGHAWNSPPDGCSIRPGRTGNCLAENETDGYHPQFVHGSIFGVTGSTIGPLYSDSSTAVTRDLGNGHSENDLRPEFRKFAEPMRWFGTTESRVPDYVAAMRATHGAEAERILIEGAPARDDLPQPVHRRDPGVQHSTGRGERVRAVLDGGAIGWRA